MSHLCTWTSAWDCQVNGPYGQSWMTATRHWFWSKMIHGLILGITVRVQIWHAGGPAAAETIPTLTQKADLQRQAGQVMSHYLLVDWWEEGSPDVSDVGLQGSRAGMWECPIGSNPHRRQGDGQSPAVRQECRLTVRMEGKNRLRQFT